MRRKRVLLRNARRRTFCVWPFLGFRSIFLVQDAFESWATLRIWNCHIVKAEIILLEEADDKDAFSALRYPRLGIQHSPLHLVAELISQRAVYDVESPSPVVTDEIL